MCRPGGCAAASIFLWQGRGWRQRVTEELCAEEKLRWWWRLQWRVGEPVSSTHIRGLLEEGRSGGQPLAGSLVLRGFSSHPRPPSGPPSGLSHHQPGVSGRLSLPRFGVYASVTELNGVAYSALPTLGVKPTVGADRSPFPRPGCPATGAEVYGERPVGGSLAFIRPERKFDSLEACGIKFFRTGKPREK